MPITPIMSEIISNVARTARSVLRRLASSWLYVPLMRLYYWIQLTVVKKAVQLSKVSLVLLAIEVRLLDSRLRQIGEDEKHDNVVHWAVAAILRNDRFRTGEIDASQQNFVNELVTLAEPSVHVREAAATYRLAQAYPDSAMKRPE